MARLMISVSGIRGIIGEGLTPEIITQFAQAYGTFCEGRPVVIGQDGRVSGRMVHDAFVSGLISVGCDVIDLGIATTPTIALATQHMECGGGIIISASHNPVEWNGIKMLASDGLFLDAEQGARVLEIKDKQMFALKHWDGLGTVKNYEHAVEDHINNVLALPYVDAEKIRQRKFTVVADCINGSGALIVPKLLEQLGCNVIVMNGEATGRFARMPEPLPENLKEVGAAVKKHNADLAVVVDPDSDRLALVAETGEPIGEEYTLGVVGEFLLKHKQGKIVLNVSTSRVLEDLALEKNCEVVRTKVGEINVTMTMRELGAVFGGEGNGGVILPDSHLGRDAIVGIVLVLQHLAETNEMLGQIRARLPQYFMVKQKIELPATADPKALVQQLTETYKNDKLDLIDGLKILRDRSWVQVRASNTEPILRVMAEAPTESEANALANELNEATQKLLT